MSGFGRNRDRAWRRSARSPAIRVVSDPIARARCSQPISYFRALSATSSALQERVMTAWENAASKWTAAKPAAIALAIGLVAGPLISNAIGWQVTSGTARAEIHAGIVEQQAMFCEARA